MELTELFCQEQSFQMSLEFLSPQSMDFTNGNHCIILCLKNSILILSWVTISTMIAPNLRSNLFQKKKINWFGQQEFEFAETLKVLDILWLWTTLKNSKLLDPKSKKRLTIFNQLKPSIILTLITGMTLKWFSTSPRWSGIESMLGLFLKKMEQYLNKQDATTVIQMEEPFITTDIEPFSHGSTTKTTSK